MKKKKNKKKIVSKKDKPKKDFFDLIDDIAAYKQEDKHPAERDNNYDAPMGGYGHGDHRGR